MICNAIQILKCPFAVLMAVAAVSFAALMAAFAAEAFLGLEPCILCVYQRWPFALTVCFGIIGAAFKRGLIKPMLGLSGLTMLGNSGIAFYHTGVEQKFWVSAVEGCAVNFGALSGSGEQSILQNIMSAPTGNCADIPWSDPVLGLSMANYNVLLCAALGFACLISLYLSRHAHHGQARHSAEG